MPLTTLQLRTATRAALVALKADGSDLEQTQSNAIDTAVATIDAESANDPSGLQPPKESTASSILYGLRTALEAIPVITSALTATGVHGAAMTPYQIVATHSPDTYAATGLPGGVVLNTTTGLITGTWPAAGTYNVVMTATNSGGVSASATLVLTST